MNFWTSAHGGLCQSRRLEMREWNEIAANYGPAGRDGLEELMQLSGPPGGGNLLLWQGPPGTGKTNALRALGWEWRKWCEIEYVVDPEALLGQRPEYLMTVLTSEYEQAARPGPADQNPPWRLLVLEDSGELVRADAKAETGQALSRLLNVVDGIIGQGLRVLVLITTNEELGRLHPAITRPGRCLSTIEFTLLDRQAASAWLAARGISREVGSATPLADLFAIAAGRDPEPVAEAVGFAA